MNFSYLKLSVLLGALFLSQPSSFARGDCLSNSKSCESNNDCCSGFCNRRNKCRPNRNPTLSPTPVPTPVPTPAPVNSCRDNSESCSSNNDCCSGFCNSRNKCRRSQGPVPSPVSNPTDAPVTPPAPSPVTSPTPAPIPNPTNGDPPSLSDSMEDCVYVANQFDNTCTSPTQVDSDHDFIPTADLPSEMVTCENWPTDSNFPCIGWTEGTSCKWHRTLCMTCFPHPQDGKTMVRFQTNSMPNHCPGSSLTAPQTFDYEVLFNAPVSSPQNYVDFLNEPTTRRKFIPGGGLQDVTYNNGATAEVRCSNTHVQADDEQIVYICVCYSCQLTLFYAFFLLFAKLYSY